MMDHVETKTDQQLVDQLWDHLLGAIFGMTAFYLGPLFGLVAIAFGRAEPIGFLVGAIIAVPSVLVGWHYARPWHKAMWEIDARRRQREDIAEAARRQEVRGGRRVDPPIEAASASWTGRNA